MEVRGALESSGEADLLAKNVFFENRGVGNQVLSYFGAFEGPSCAPSDSREKVSMCHFKEIEKDL